MRSVGVKQSRCRVRLRTEQRPSFREFERDGRVLVKEMHSYPGMPEQPLSTQELRSKFDLLTAALDPQSSDRLFRTLLNLEEVQNIRDVALG